MDTPLPLTNWTAWAPLMRTAFPHFPIPDVAPNIASYAQFVTQIAHAHDITPIETTEILDDLQFQLMSETARTKAA